MASWPTFKEFEIPSHDTFKRVLELLRPELLQAAATTFLLNEIEQFKMALLLYSVVDKFY
jgi:hypothetical protein